MGMRGASQCILLFKTQDDVDYVKKKMSGKIFRDHALLFEHWTHPQSVRKIVSATATPLKTKKIVRTVNKNTNAIKSTVSAVKPTASIWASMAKKRKEIKPQDLPDLDLALQPTKQKQPSKPPKKSMPSPVSSHISSDCPKQQPNEEMIAAAASNEDNECVLPLSETEIMSEIVTPLMDTATITETATPKPFRDDDSTVNAKHE